MAIKKLATVAIATAAVGGGMLAGAVFGVPLVSSAEGRGDVTTSSSAAGDDAPGEDAGKGDRGKGCGHGGGRFSLSAAAEALGMTEEELDTALEEEGTTIATVAEAQGVDVQVVIDALVAEATAKIDEEVADGDLTAEEAEERKADLVERVTEMVNSEPKRGGPGGGPGGGHGRPPWAGHGGLHATLSAAAEALDMSEADFRTALIEEGSLAAVAEAQGVDVQVVIDAMVAEATARIDEAVTAGDLTAEEAEERKADLVERVTAMVNGELPGKGNRGNRGNSGD